MNIPVLTYLLLPTYHDLFLGRGPRGLRPTAEAEASARIPQAMRRQSDPPWGRADFVWGPEAEAEEDTNGRVTIGQPRSTSWRNTSRWRAPCILGIYLSSTDNSVPYLGVDPPGPRNEYVRPAFGFGGGPSGDCGPGQSNSIREVAGGSGRGNTKAWPVNHFCRICDRTLTYNGCPMFSGPHSSSASAIQRCLHSTRIALTYLPTRLLTADYARPRGGQSPIHSTHLSTPPERAQGPPGVPRRGARTGIVQPR